MKSSQNVKHFLSQNSSFHSCSLLSPVGMGDYLTAHLFSALPAIRNIPSQGRRWSLGSLCREARDERCTEAPRRSRLPLLAPPTPCLRGREMGGRGLIFLIFSILQTSCRSPKNPEQFLKKKIQIGQRVPQCFLCIHCKASQNVSSAFKYYRELEQASVGGKYKVPFMFCIHSQDWYQSILGAFLRFSIYSVYFTAA